MKKKSVMAAVIHISQGKMAMCYFSWLLGLPLAATFAVLNAMWYELAEDEVLKKQAIPQKPNVNSA